MKTKKFFKILFLEGRGFTAKWEIYTSDENAKNDQTQDERYVWRQWRRRNVSWQFVLSCCWLTRTRHALHGSSSPSFWIFHSWRWCFKYRTYTTNVSLNDVQIWIWIIILFTFLFNTIERVGPELPAQIKWSASLSKNKKYVSWKD